MGLYRKGHYDLRQKVYNDYAIVADRRDNPPKEVILIMEMVHELLGQ